MPAIKRIGLIIFNVFVFLILTDSLLYFSMKNPKLGKKLHPHIYSEIRNLYNSAVRNIVQMDPQLSHYDADLFYKLTQGIHTFKNYEYSTTLNVNSLGLRDDEASLHSPQIIVIGDSHAMGWGVEQNEGFVDLLEAKLKMKILNAAISSYGTARESKSLDFIDTSKMRVLIVQYSSNDLSENENFFENHNQLKVGSKLDYANAVEKHSKATTYFFPGIYTFKLIRNFIRNLNDEGLHKVASFEKRKKEAKLFVNALRFSTKVDLSKVHILVFEISHYEAYKTKFPEALREVITEDKPPLNIEVVTIDEVFRSENFFDLDDHMNAKGHLALANILVSKMEKLRLRKILNPNSAQKGSGAKKNEE